MWACPPAIVGQAKLFAGSLGVPLSGLGGPRVSVPGGKDSLTTQRVALAGHILTIR